MSTWPRLVYARSRSSADPTSSAMASAARSNSMPSSRMAEVGAANPERIHGVSLDRPSADCSRDGDCLPTTRLGITVARGEHQPPALFGEDAGQFGRRRVLGQERSGFPVRVESCLRFAECPLVATEQRVVPRRGEPVGGRHRRHGRPLVPSQARAGQRRRDRRRRIPWQATPRDPSGHRRAFEGRHRPAFGRVQTRHVRDARALREMPTQPRPLRRPRAMRPARSATHRPPTNVRRVRRSDALVRLPQATGRRSMSSPTADAAGALHPATSLRTPPRAATRVESGNPRRLRRPRELAGRRLRPEQGLDLQNQGRPVQSPGGQ